MEEVRQRKVEKLVKRKTREKPECWMKDKDKMKPTGKKIIWGTEWFLCCRGRWRSMSSSVVSTWRFVYSGMACPIYTSSLGPCVCVCVHVYVCVNGCQKRCLTAHIGKTEPIFTMTTSRKLFFFLSLLCFHSAAQSGHLHSPLSPPVWSVHSQKKANVQLDHS